MDIARPEIKRQKRRRQIIWSVVGLVVLVWRHGWHLAPEAGRAHRRSQHHLDRYREARLHAAPGTRFGLADSQP